MVTTIQVQNSTLQLMKRIKNDFKVSTYDEVINKLIELKRKIPKSKFGAHPEMSEFTIQDESEFHDL
jgi:hypothetical protein